MVLAAADGRLELALAEARLQLARELNDANEQTAALRDILKVQQGRLEDAKKLAAVGRISPDDVETNRVAVLEAEVRLLRVQKNSSKP
jgi:outer membrane protein TolC